MKIKLLFVLFVLFTASNVFAQQRTEKKPNLEAVQGFDEFVKAFMVDCTIFFT